MKNIYKHLDVVLEALEDYRKWFDDGESKANEIDDAVKFLGGEMR